MKLSLIAGAALLALSGSLYAQSSQPQAAPAQKAERRFDCSKAKDPKACEERREKVRAARAKAAEACKGAAQGERRDCMRREMCAQSADPAKCEARAKERAERRQNRQKKQ
jgi:hypothetical protein